MPFQNPPAPVTSGELDPESLKQAIRGVGGEEPRGSKKKKRRREESERRSWEFVGQTNSARLAKY